MANLPESSTFDSGVYQIETTDPVIGGPSGVTNTPLKSLANRTKYLKDHVDALETGHVGATGNAHGAATSAVAGFMSASDKAKLDGIAAGAQVNAVQSVAGRTGAVTLAVADVSGAAPTASPTFTGTPAAPTAAQGTNTTQLATTAFVAAAVGGIQTAMPGEVSFFAMNTPPSGYLKANGAAVSRTTYAALFSAVGTTFGAGNGSTTFNLPDLRGEFLRGWDDARGIDNGRAFGSAQGDSFASHSHSLTVHRTLSDGYFADVQGADSQNPNYGSTYTLGTSMVGGSETRPRNVALLACIKY